MKIEVFDDWRSIVHVLVGALTLFAPLIFPAYVAYELVEFCERYAKYKKREVRAYIGDMLEYFTGIAVMSLITLFI